MQIKRVLTTGDGEGRMRLSEGRGSGNGECYLPSPLESGNIRMSLVQAITENNFLFFFL